MLDKLPYFIPRSRLVISNQPYYNEFLDVMKKVFQWSRGFGVAGPGRSLWMLWGFVIMVVMFAIECGAIYKFVKLLMGLTAYSAGNRSVTARLAGTIFYSTCLVSLVLSWRLSRLWNKLSLEWVAVEKRLTIPVPEDRTLRRRMVVMMVAMTVCAFVEHAMSVVSSVQIFDKPVLKLLEIYVMQSHGFIFIEFATSLLIPSQSSSLSSKVIGSGCVAEKLRNPCFLKKFVSDEHFSEADLTVWLSLLVFFISNVATILWSFQDLLIILVSMGLTSRYCRLNQCVAKVLAGHRKETQWCKNTQILRVYTWRKIREAYVKQAMLVRKVDQLLGGLIVLSSSGNFYFICLQLFLGITQGLSGPTLSRVYYTVSLFWVCTRFVCVVLYAADVNVNSRSALRYLHACNARCYNVEIDRLQQQLAKDYVALSGMGLFHLDRSILLKMLGAIITYELVLIQFDHSEYEF